MTEKTKGLDAYELKKVLPLMEAIREYNPRTEDSDAIVAEVTLWRHGRDIAVITDQEGDGLRLITNGNDARD